GFVAQPFLPALSSPNGAVAPFWPSILSRTTAFVPLVVPPPLHPKPKATARTALCASFPPTVAIENHTSVGSVPRAPKLCAGTLPVHSHSSRTILHTASPAAETTPAQTAGTALPKTA